MIKIQKLKNLFHLIEAIIANLYYRLPSRKLRVIGVTGTDGKTTTTHLIYHILKSAGKKVSMVSTIYAKVGSKEFDTGLHTTTPGSFLIQKLLKKAVNYGDEYFVLETTSHALDQNRVLGVNFLIGVLTNITYEHLDYHKTYNDYLKAKAKLLLSSKIAVINRDDQSYSNIKCQISSFDKLRMTLSETEVSKIKNTDKKLKIITYGLKNKADYCWDLKLNLPDFNKYNYLAAYTACRILGLSDNSILSAIKSFQLPKGRLDVVHDKNFKVIIDFAHTPNAIAKVLDSVRILHLKKGSQLIHVFGSAGLRDSSKRPLMGQASAKFSNIIILTEEDYRTENVNETMKQIEKGIIRKLKVKSEKLKVIKIPNRQEAINKAVALARTGDVVIITGKGHEKSLCRGKIEYPWDEYEAVGKALKFLITNYSN
jgi:UDP-N-acetylmuramoyl-L-alanyl-D-glutamate--2,6-diaminopimelate ligase